MTLYSRVHQGESYSREVHISSHSLGMVEGHCMPCVQWSTDTNQALWCRVSNMLYLGHSVTSGAPEPSKFYQLFSVLTFWHQLSPDYQMEGRNLQEYSCYFSSLSNSQFEISELRFLKTRKKSSSYHTEGFIGSVKLWIPMKTCRLSLVGSHFLLWLLNI